MQSLPTCTRPCLVPKSFPSKDRECDVIYSCPIKCTDQRDWLQCFLIYIKSQTFLRRSFASHCSSTQTKVTLVTLFPSKINNSSELHSLHFSGKLFSSTKKITINLQVKISSFFLYSCLRDNKFAVIRLNKKLTNKVLLCNHREFYLELNAPKKQLLD